MMSNFQLTQEQINEIISKLSNLSITSRFDFTNNIVLGFSKLIQEDNTVWIVTDKFTQNKKRIVLIKPSSKVNEIFTQFESQHSGKFERLNADLAKQIYESTHILPCNEDGTELIQFDEFKLVELSPLPHMTNKYDFQSTLTGCPMATTNKLWYFNLGL